MSEGEQVEAVYFLLNNIKKILCEDILLCLNTDNSNILAQQAAAAILHYNSRDAETLVGVSSKQALIIFFSPVLIKN